MNRTRLLMIGVLALALGALVSVLVYKNLQARGPVGEVGVDVVVAATDIQVGSKVDEHDIRLAKFPPADLPQGAYTRRSQVLGRGVIVPITRGEFVLPTKLAPENAGAGLPSLIPPGMRAISIHSTDVVSVAGFVTPGTRVDVLLTGTPNGGTESQTTTVLQNVAVIAAGHTLERTATGEPQNTPVITLLVSPDDAQRLTLASSEGRIQLVLRNPLDTRQDELAASSAKGLYRGLAPSAAPAAHPHPVSKKKAEPTTQAPSVFSVDVIHGDKKPEEFKFPEESPPTK